MTASAAASGVSEHNYQRCANRLFPIQRPVSISPTRRALLPNFRYPIPGAQTVRVRQVFLDRSVRFSRYYFSHCLNQPQLPELPMIIYGIWNTRKSHKITVHGICIGERATYHQSVTKAVEWKTLAFTSTHDTFIVWCCWNQFEIVWSIYHEFWTSESWWKNDEIINCKI